MDEFVSLDELRQREALQSEGGFPALWLGAMYSDLGHPSTWVEVQAASVDAGSGNNIGNWIWHRGPDAEL